MASTRTLRSTSASPGSGPILGARVLAEFGDDPTPLRRRPSPQELRRHQPDHPASGKKKVVLARYVRNDRLADALHQQAFCALSSSPGARAYYDALRARGIGHHAALRQLGNRLVGILHGCLKTTPPTTKPPPGPAPAINKHAA